MALKSDGHQSGLPEIPKEGQENEDNHEQSELVAKI